MKPACGVLGRDSGLEDQTEQSHKVGLCVRVTDLVLKLQQACLQGLAGSRARTRILTSSEAVHRAAHLSSCSALALDRARSHPDFERSARLQSGRPTAGEALESVAPAVLAAHFARLPDERAYCGLPPSHAEFTECGHPQPLHEQPAYNDFGPPLHERRDSYVHGRRLRVTAFAALAAAVLWAVFAAA